MQLAAKPILRHGGPVAWRSVVLNQKRSCSNATKTSTVVCCERRAGGEEGKAPVGGGPVQSRTVPEQAPIKVIPLEKAGSEAWAGVAALDKGEEGMPGWLQTSILVTGDAIGLITFAAIGRINHGEILDLETLGTALPFLIGWFSSSALFGGYGSEARSGGVLSAAGTAGKCWIIGTPIGLGIRGAYLGYPPPTPFIIVSMVATGVLMVGWRSAFAYLSSGKGNSSKSPGASQGNKKGGPFDFLKLLFNLTQRW